MDDFAKFFRACRTGNVTMIRAMLDKGVDANARDADYITGLIWAGRKGNIEAARVLVEHGADMELSDKRGRTALFHAAKFSRCDFVEYLASLGAEVNPIDCHGCTPMDIAAMEYPRPTNMVPILERLGGVHAEELRPNNSSKPKPLRRSA
jgi:ankyrin repeat protein